jgi:hypothetical protein
MALQILAMVMLTVAQILRVVLAAIMMLDMLVEAALFALFTLQLA